jgi:putative transposase
MKLNGAGEMIRDILEQLPNRFDNIELDAFIVMPNHVHGIINIVGARDDSQETDTPADVCTRCNAHEQNSYFVGAPLVGALENDRPGALENHRAGTRPAPTLGDVVGKFKSISTHEYVIGVRQKRWPAFNTRLWQRNYYERIIRNEKELNETRQYIADNPLKWNEDENYV